MYLESVQGFGFLIKKENQFKKSTPDGFKGQRVGRLKNLADSAFLEFVHEHWCST